jgi:hypothetical protein
LENAPRYLIERFRAYGNTTAGSWKNFTEALHQTGYQSDDEDTQAPAISTPPQFELLILSEPSGDEDSSVRKLAPFPLRESSPLANITSTLSRTPSPFPEHEDEDWSEVCPFCDDPLPSGTESEQLISIREHLVRSGKAWKKVGSENPFSLTAASFMDYAVYCEQHHLKNHLIGARERNWPLLINFEALPKRVFNISHEIPLFISQLELYHEETHGSTAASKPLVDFNSGDTDVDLHHSFIRLFHDV